MRAILNSPVGRYGLALATIALAAWTRVQFDSTIGLVPFLPFFLAVLITASYAGLGPGLLATVLGLLSTTVVPLAGDPVGWVPALLRFGISSIVATILIERVRRSERELRGERELRISELGGVNQELRRRVEELQTLLESAPVAIWVAHDAECRVVTANRWARALMGDDAAREGEVMAPIELDRLRALADGSEVQAAELPLRQAASTGIAARDRELEIVREDRPSAHVTVSAAPLHDDHGRVRGAIAVAVDVTSRHHADRARAELAAIVESSDDAIIGKTLDGTITSWNAAAERLFGYTAEEVIGRSIAIIVPPQRLAELSEILARLARGERLEHFDTTRVRKDGKLVEVAATVSPVLGASGKVIGASAISRDVTDRQRTEATLRFLAEASESLSTLVDYRSTLERVATLAVPGFADWCAVDMLAGDGAIERLAVAHVDPSKRRLAEIFQRRYPPDPAASYGVPQVLRTGVSEIVREISDAMIVATVPDDKRRAIVTELGLRSYMCVPLRTKNRTLGVISFVAAESGRRYDERDLAAAEDLARRAAIAIENARLYQELRESDRRKDEFLAVLSHELRNPLAPIRSGIDMMAMDGAPQHPQMIELMRDQVEHLIRLVDDLLDISRISRGRVELRCETVELGNLLERSADAMRSTLEGRRQSLSVERPATPVWLDADPVRLLQVLENLLQNASKFSDEGARIELKAEAAGKEAVIRVRDYGIGMDAALLSRLFQPFTQASQSIDRAQGGLGIGLALVRGLVERHGGTVAAASAGPSLGSELVARLPLTSEAPRPAPLPAPVPVTAPDARRILVVDDNVAAAQMLSLLLSRLGRHQVSTAYDGPSAVEKVRSDHPEIVLLDIGLPTMDGYEVGRTIRQDPEFDDVLMVALTGYGQEEDRRRSRAAGFDEHLVKPPAIEDIERLFVHPKLR